MKGLSVSVEEKAQRYDEALEKARQLCAYPTTKPFISDLQDLFPELTEESKDERIRKRIILCLEECVHNDIIRDYEKDECLAWLEKQGKTSPILSNSSNIGKVESKFKVGDWFVKNDGSHINKEYNTCKISKVGNVYYEIESIYGDIGKISFESFDTNYHIWTIQDAKDGDVLNSTRVKATIIFKGWNSDGKHIIAYCAIQQGILIKQELPWDRDFEPATKEWRDTLFAKIKESGYEWDADKKELKKIEQKPAWSEEDEEMLDSIIEEVRYIGDFPDYPTKEENELYDECLAKVEWLKSLKDRVQPQPKQEWSEEDEHRIKDIIYFLDTAKKHYASTVELDACIDWLKSLRPQNKTYYWTENEIKFAISDYIRGVESYEKMVEKLRCLKPRSQWKPSEEMLEALYKVIPENVMAISEDEMLLDKLYQGLKYGRVLSKN